MGGMDGSAEFTEDKLVCPWMFNFELRTKDQSGMFRSCSAS